MWKEPRKVHHSRFCTHIGVDSQAGEPDVVPIHVLGITDVDLTQTLSSDLMAFTLANFADPLKGGYIVRHSRHALDDFGECGPGYHPSPGVHSNPPCITNGKSLFNGLQEVSCS